MWEGLGAMPPPGTTHPAPPSPINLYSGDFVEASPQGRMGDSSISSPSLQIGQGWNPQASGRGLGFVGTSPHPGATQSPLIRTKTLILPRKL